MMSLDISEGKGAERKKERKKSEQREREREKSERWLWNNELVKFTCKLKL